MKDRDGAIAMLFGLMAFAFAMMSGMALDYSRVIHTRGKLTAAVDAAALAAGKALLDGRMTDGEITQMAKDYFTNNMNSDSGLFGSIGEPDIHIDRTTSSIVIDATAVVPMTLTRMAGFEDITLPVNSATTFEQQDIELSLALDLTGSMNGPGKLSALKTATKDLVDILLPDAGTPNEVRIAFAPYSSGVNAGQYAAAAAGQASNGCTYEREGANPTGDQAPGLNNYLKVIGDAGINNNGSCPSSAPVVALTDDKDVLKTTVDSYTAGGATAGHLGTQWAWYLLSPNWASVFGRNSQPEAYNDPNTMKAMILMTDGLFNTVGGTWYGDSSQQADQSQAWTVEMCNNMRAQGVTVYTVGFQLDDISNSYNRDRATQTLLDCAGNPNRFYDADNPDELSTAFATIANQLNNLRLTH